MQYVKYQLEDQILCLVRNQLDKHDHQNQLKHYEVSNH